MTDLRTFEEIAPGDRDIVGGKGLSLGQMARAGLPVPPGFCITSHVHRRLRGQSPRDDAALADALRAAYRALGGGRVAVRSSATAEDGSEASFAGQQETILGVEGEDALLDAIRRCWDSLDSERAVAYRRQQGIREDGLAMAVVVQKLVEAEAAGVLFTRDPLDPEGRRMLVEASWGLGEAVVSGRIMPDRFHLDPDAGAVIEQQRGQKTELLTATGWQPTSESQRDSFCLDATQLAAIADLGRKIEALYGEPRDVEWAWAQGQCWLLQARPITTASAAEREQVRREEIAALRELAAPGGTVWSRFNLAEILPAPTPMTWSIVQRFMSGQGGFGLTYRDLGYKPDPALDDVGVYDLVCGRPYCNLSREPRLYARGQPLHHDMAVYRAEPRKALTPQARPDWSRAGWKYWLFFPLHFVRSLGFEVGLQNWSKSFAAKFRQEIVPRFAAETAKLAAENLTALPPPALLEKLEQHIQRTLYDFARDSLKPTVLAAVAMGKLSFLLNRVLGPERGSAALGELVMGVKPDPEADLPTALAAVSEGKLTRAEFLGRFGHRGAQEMELAQPRWAEDHAVLDRWTASAKPHTAEPLDAVWQRIATEARLGSLQRQLCETELKHLHDYLALRETGKHHFMAGYALIRRVLVELGRRFGIGDGVFFLTLADLPTLVAGQDLTVLIAQRRRRRAIVLSLDAPLVLFSDDLEAIGRPEEIAGAEVLQGVPLSAGVVEAQALVLDEPRTEGLPVEPYILVCPSTDPAWVPLFVQARGLVMETGGVLSHGAIVAREFGLPAVAGLPQVQRRLRTGQRLRIDGSRGVVTVLEG